MHLLFDESASYEEGMIRRVIVGSLARRVWLGCLLSTVPSLGSFSSSSCIQTEHSLHYGRVGFRIGHFLRYTHADLNLRMPALSSMRKCSLTGGWAKFFPGKALAA